MIFVGVLFLVQCLQVSRQIVNSLCVEKLKNSRLNKGRKNSEDIVRVTNSRTDSHSERFDKVTRFVGQIVQKLNILPIFLLNGWDYVRTTLFKIKAILGYRARKNTQARRTYRANIKTLKYSLKIWANVTLVAQRQRPSAFVGSPDIWPHQKFVHFFLV